MFNLFERLPADPSKRFNTPFLRLSDKNVSRIYSQQAGDPDAIFATSSYRPQDNVTLKMTAFEWVHILLR